MSFTTCDIISVNDPAMFKKVASRAEELTREQSLARIGYDLTRPSPAQKSDYLGFTIGEDDICWNDFSGNPAHMSPWEIIRQLSTEFPDLDFDYSVSMEGPVVYRATVRGGVKYEKKRYALWLRAEGVADFGPIRRMLADGPGRDVGAVESDEPVCPGVLVLRFREMTDTDFEETVKEVLDSICPLVPEGKMTALLAVMEEQGSWFKSKTVVDNGRFSWKDLTPEEEDKLYKYRLDPDDPDIRAFELLF